MAIHSSGHTIFNLAHIEGITLGASEEVDEGAGGASGIGVDRIGEVGERQVAEVYGAGFTVGSLAGKGARGETRIPVPAESKRSGSHMNPSREKF